MFMQENKELVVKGKNKMVEIIDGDLYTSSWRMSQLFDVEHRSLKQTIRKNFDDIIEVGEIAPILRKTFDISNVEIKHQKGRPIVEFLLNEPQATFVLLLLKGKYKNDSFNYVVKFKKYITKEFFRQRKLLTKLLVQQQNVEWLAKRDAGKLDRRTETDAIKEFVAYAKAQGSTHAEKYYMIITKMENQTLFCLEYLEQKYPNLRDIVNMSQLSTLESADKIIAKAIKEGMEKSMNYKDIYILAKERVENFSAIIGKTPLQQITQDIQKRIS
jgi:hypothetical protein